MKSNSRPHFETPTALSHDVSTLAEDARHLLDATAEIADEKVAEARQRLYDSLEAGKETYANLRSRVVKTAKVADHTVRTHPYESIFVAFGVGALIGFLATRRK